MSNNRGWSYAFEDESRIKLVPMALEKVKVCCALKTAAMSEDVAAADRRTALNTLLSAKGDTTGNLSSIPDSDLSEIARLVCPEPDEWTRNLVGTLCGYNVDGKSLAAAQAHLALARKCHDAE